MSTAGEILAIVPVVEQPVEETKAPAEPKPVKEKKPKETKTASHPPYFQMIKEALLALKERNGSSPYAIAKYMEENHKSTLPANFKKRLNLQLKNQAARGKLVKIKASYKLSQSEKPKKEKKSVAAKVTKANGAEKKQQRPKRKRNEAVKKAVTKKKTKKVSGPAKPKKPKFIKSLVIRGLEKLMLLLHEI